MFTRCSIFSYFLHLNCYNFLTALTKSIKLHFLEIAFQPLKTGQLHITTGTQQEITAP